MPGLQSFKTFNPTITEAVKKKPANHANYDKKVLVIGYGSVGQAIVPLLIKHIVNDPKQVTVIEKDDHGKLFRKRHGGSGVKYIKKEILRNNMASVLKQHTEAGGFIVDAWSKGGSFLSAIVAGLFTAGGSMVIYDAIRNMKSDAPKS